MKKILFIVFLGSLFIIWHTPLVWSGSVEILIDKLVEKKILSEDEAEEILKELEEEEEREKAETVQEVKEAITKGEKGVTLVKVPEWVLKMKFKGDFRLRYQITDREGRPERHRGRYRLRAGIETEIVDKVKVAFGLATGSSDPRSTNQSLTDSFDTPDIRLDYAYAEYTPFTWATLVGGKIKNPIWRPADLLWDSDIRPEGGAAKLSWELHPTFKVFANLGVFVLDERSGDQQDPFMYALQPGFDWKITDTTHLKTAATFYGFSNVEDTVLDHSRETNTLRNDVLRYDYDAFGMGSELGFQNPCGTSLPYLAFLGEYIKNPDPEKDNEGFLAGWKLGHKKVKEKGQWQARYMYRRLERDAWPDILPDSDFYQGETNARGHEVVFKCGVNKHVVFGLDYYYAEKIRGKSESENLLQVDMEFKF